MFESSRHTCFWRAELRLVAATACLGMAMAACGNTPSDETAEVGNAKAEVINGSLVAGNAAGVVVAAVNPSNDAYTECSGVMLNAAWMLTAKHCVDAPHSTSVRVVAKAQPDPLVPFESWPRTLNSYEIYKHPTEDVALVHFQAQVGYALSYQNPIYGGSDQSLVGRTLTCYGYGASGYDYFPDLRLRRADLVPSSAGRATCGILEDCTYSATGYFMPANAQGQVQWHGDSGGPCFVTADGARYVAGIAHKSTYDSTRRVVTGHWQSGAEHFRDWVYAVTKTSPAPPGLFTYVNVTTTSSTATISWNTSAPATAQSWVSADGLNWSMGTCMYPSTLIPYPCGIANIVHEASFKNLRPGTTYSYQLAGRFDFFWITPPVLAKPLSYYAGQFTTQP